MIAIPCLIADESQVIKTDDQINWKFSKNKFLTKSCLYVEDQIANQLLMKQILQHLGFSFTIAKNGQEGFKEYINSNGNFDVIITDLRMPVLSGQGMITKIRKYERRISGGDNWQNIQYVPIIITTGEVEEGERSRCLSHLGANQFINKPIKFENLYAILSLILSIDRPNESKCEEEKLSPQNQTTKNKLQIPLELNKQEITKILVIEDDKFLNSILTQFIQSGEFLVDQIYSKTEVEYIYIYI